MGNILKQITKSKIKIILYVLIAIITIFSFIHYGAYYDGSKTEKQMIVAKKIDVKAGQTAGDEEYVEIYTAEDLKKVAEGLSGKYVLMADIDMSNKMHTIIGQVQNKPFKGEFDGNNHTISNLNIDSSEQYVGLFGYINNGIVKNLKLSNINVNSTNQKTAFVGGVAGFSNGQLTNIEVSGNIKSSGDKTNLYLGQIVGYNQGNISRAHSNGTIQSLGNLQSGYIGGIAGYNRRIIKLSYNTGNIIANNIKNIRVGGIAGTSNKSVAICYSKGTMQINAETANIGGIVGENTGKVSSTYSIDTIQKNATNTNAGGIVGINSGNVVNSYWNINGIQEQEGKGTLKSLEELKRQNTYKGWNFTKIWSIKENSDTPTLRRGLYYYDDEYWEWHTRITTDDKAYNGNHIEIMDSIKFYGYWQNSYKDFLYKDYPYAGEKTFSFVLDETKADYHTLDGAGFIFNAKQEDGKLSGYAILVGKSNIELYRMDDIDIATFEVTGNRTMKSYAGDPIATVNKRGVQLHKFVIKTSPTNVTVVDNEQEILNVDLDYSKHSGESFGLISSYAQHNCTSLTQIEFLEFSLDLDNYVIPVLKVNEDDEPLQGAEFQVKNEAGEVVRRGTTNEDGIYEIEGLQEGIYTLEETKAPSTYAFKNRVYRFKITNNGKAVDVETGEEITFKIVNEALKFEVRDYIIDTEKPISESKIQLYDENGKAVLGKDGKPIIAVTDGEGKATFTGIEAEKTYTYKQIEVPEGYIINNTINKVVVENDGKVIYIEDEDGNGKDGIIYNKIKTKEDSKDSENGQNKTSNDQLGNKVNSTKGNEENLKQGILPNAGNAKFIVIGILTLIILAVYCAIRYKKIY